MCTFPAFLRILYLFLSLLFYLQSYAAFNVVLAFKCTRISNKKKKKEKKEKKLCLKMRLMGENQPYQLASQLVSQACHTKQPTRHPPIIGILFATLLMSCSAALLKWRKDFLAVFFLCCCFAQQQL